MNTALRIAVVSAFPPGRRTLNEYAYHLVRALSEQDNIAEIIVLADRITEQAEEIDLGPKVRVERVWEFNSVASGFKILGRLKSLKPDGALWNVQSASFGDREIPAGLGLMIPGATRLAGVSSGIIAHNLIGAIDLENTHLRGRPLRQKIIRFGGDIVTRAMLSSAYTTVLVKSYRDFLRQRYPRADVDFLPHGSFEVTAPDIQPWSERPRRIVTMGKFGTYKRLETLLRAFDIVRLEPDLSDFSLVIGGSDHPNTPGYIDGLKKLRASDAGVVFHGYVAENDVPDFFGSARLSVFDYSSTTGSSGVLHQTASYGAVPVFPAIGDFVDICRDEGIVGVNYRSQDPEDLARAMMNALRSGEASEHIASQNALASMHVPMSTVARYHADRFQSFVAPKGKAA